MPCRGGETGVQLAAAASLCCFQARSSIRPARSAIHSARQSGQGGPAVLCSRPSPGSLPFGPCLTSWAPSTAMAQQPEAQQAAAYFVNAVRRLAAAVAGGGGGEDALQAAMAAFTAVSNVTAHPSDDLAPLYFLHSG